MPRSIEVAYQNALLAAAAYKKNLAETINGLYKTEVIRQQGPWRNIEAVEFATLTWVDSWNLLAMFHQRS